MSAYCSVELLLAATDCYSPHIIAGDETNAHGTHAYTSSSLLFFLLVITGYLHSSHSNVKLRHTAHPPQASHCFQDAGGDAVIGRPGEDPPVSAQGEDDHLHMVVASMFQKRMFIFASISNSLSN